MRRLHRTGLASERSSALQRRLGEQVERTPLRRSPVRGRAADQLQLHRQVLAERRPPATDAAASHAASKSDVAAAGVPGARRPVVEQHHQPGQAGVHVLAHHQLADPGRGAPVHVPQLVADHVLAQRGEGDAAVRHPVDPAVQAAATARPARPAAGGCAGAPRPGRARRSGATTPTRPSGSRRVISQRTDLDHAAPARSAPGSRPSCPGPGRSRTSGTGTVPRGARLAATGRARPALAPKQPAGVARRSASPVLASPRVTRSGSATRVHRRAAAASAAKPAPRARRRRARRAPSSGQFGVAEPEARREQQRRRRRAGRTPRAVTAHRPSARRGWAAAGSRHRHRRRRTWRSTSRGGAPRASAASGASSRRWANTGSTSALMSSGTT